MSKKQAFLVLPCLMVLIAVSYYSCVKDSARLPVPVSLSLCDSLNVKYSTDIKAMSQTYCATPGCHDGSGGAPLNFNLYADLKIYADNGLLKSRVIDLKDMPSTGPLPDSLIQKVKCWINAGAPNN